MIRFIMLLIILLTIPSTAFAIQGPEYVDYLPNFSLSPAPECAWPPIDIVRDEIDFWNNHPYYPFIGEDDFTVYIVQSYMRYSGLAGGGIWLSSADSFCDMESTEYTFLGTQPMSEGRIARTLGHEVSHTQSDARFSEIERKSFFALIGYKTNDYMSLDSDHMICSWFIYLWGSTRANGWEGTPAPPSIVGPFYAYRLYYAFYDCMVNDHDKFEDYSVIPDKKRGDVDGDGDIDCSDLEAIKALKNTNAYYNDFYRFWAADYDGNNRVNDRDVELVAKKIGSCNVVIYDLNDDGKVDIKDKLLLSSNLGRKGNSFKKFDLNNDGKIDILDLLELSNAINEQVKSNFNNSRRSH